MLASFFQRSKPIHFVLLAIYLVVFAFLSFHEQDLLSFEHTVDIIKSISLSVFSMAIFKFISSKNGLTENNNYQILIYAGFVAATTVIFLEIEKLIAVVFILLALRRILSVKSNLDVIQKYFDAGFWLGFACYFWPAAGLLLLVIYAAVILYTIEHFRTWILPILGVLASYILLTCYSIVRFDTWLHLDFQYYDLNFSQYSSLWFSVLAGVFIVFSLWSGASYVMVISKARQAQRPNYFIIIILLMISVIIAVFSPEKNASEYILIAIPLAVMMTQWIQRIQEKVVVDIILWSILLLPLLRFVL